MYTTNRNMYHTLQTLALLFLIIFQSISPISPDNQPTPVSTPTPHHRSPLACLLLPLQACQLSFFTAAVAHDTGTVYV